MNRWPKLLIDQFRVCSAAAAALLAVLALPAWAAKLRLAEGDPVQLSTAPTAPANPVVMSAKAKVIGPTDAPADKPTFSERALRQREILGTSFRGNVFVDGLPLSPAGVQIGRAFELRRARMGFVRQLPRRWEARGSAELSSGRFELKEFYVRKHFDRLGTVTIGNQSEPMGLNELTSKLSQPLLEPSLPTALVPGHNFGVAVGNRHSSFHYQTGVFGSGTEQEGRRDLGAAFTARITHRTTGPSGDVQHLGFGMSHRKQTGSEQFRTVPEVGIGQEQLVDTGTIDDARSTLRASFEYIQTFGRWSVLGELLRVRVQRRPGAQLQFGGAYVEATWMAWGDGPRYDDGDAVLTRAPVTAAATWGNAWGRGNLALTARLSRIDLTDADVDGGTETNLSIGATWDISTRTRVAINVVRFIDLTGANKDAEKSSAVAVRFQYAW